MALGSPALRVRSEGRRWGVGICHIRPTGRPLPPPRLRAARGCLRLRPVPRDRAALAPSSASPLRVQEAPESAPRQAENPLAHRGLAAAIIVTRREVLPPPPEKPGGWGPAGAARRRRLRRGCAQARLRTPPRNWGRGDCGCGRPAAYAGAVPVSRGLEGGRAGPATWAFSGPPPPRLPPGSARRLELRNPLA